MNERIGRLLAVGNVAEMFVWGALAAAEAMGLPVPKVWSGQEIGGRRRSVDRVKQASFAEQKLNNATLWGRRRECRLLAPTGCDCLSINISAVGG